MNISIRKARCTDIDALEKLYDDLNDYLASHIHYPGPGWRKHIYPTRVDALHFLESDTLYIAEADGKLAGCVALTHEPEKAPDNGTWLIDAEYRDIFVIHILAVHPNFLRKGVGTAMLQFAEQLGSEQGIKSIRLDVYENNLTARNAYEKCGYQYIDKVDIGLGHYGLDWFCLYEKVLAV